MIKVATKSAPVNLMSLNKFLFGLVSVSVLSSAFRKACCHIDCSGHPARWSDGAALNVCSCLSLALLRVCLQDVVFAEQLSMHALLPRWP